MWMAAHVLIGQVTDYALSKTFGTKFGFFPVVQYAELYS